MDKPGWICLAGGSSEVFSWGGQASEVLQAFSQLRRLGRFCDVVLVAGGRRLPAHRALLAGSCPYFDAMFTSGMKEEQQQEVALGGLSFEGLTAVVDFLYSGELRLDGGNVGGVLQAAHLLQVLRAVDFCCQYLELQVNQDTYLDLQELAGFYQLERLDLFIDRFILDRFTALSLTTDFLQRTSINKLTCYLCSDKISHPWRFLPQVQQDGERSLLCAALQWLAHMPQRAGHAHQLLSHIRLPLVSVAELANGALPALGSLLPEDGAARELVEEALLYHRELYAQPVLQTRRTELRGGVDRLLLTGGQVFERGQRLTSSVSRLDGVPPGVWEEETALPVWRSHHSVAVLGGFVFAAGGSTSSSSERDTACDLLHRYNPRDHQWTQCASMNLKRSDFFLGAVGDGLIAVGGRNHTGAQFSVEVYKPAQDRWSFVSRLPKCSYGHGGAVLDDIVYISGGQDSMAGVFRSDFLSYDPSRDEDGWAELKPMHEVRSWHCMASLHHLVYAIGGSTNYGDVAEHYDTQRVEAYDVRHRQWTQVAPLLHPNSEAAAAVWDGRVFVLGGYSWERMEFFNGVQVYDPDRRQWVQGPDLRESTAGAAACVCMVRPRAALGAALGVAPGATQVDHRKDPETDS